MTTRANFPPGQNDGSVVDSRRTSYRAEVASEIMVRQTNTQLFQTVLSDLSVTGFKMPGLQTLAAHIRWVHYQDYGCEFTSPLHPAVLDHIVSVLRK